MRIKSLYVANFKAIDQVSLDDLSDVVVIAGSNGSGKSTIFDAIRFWKSAIGAYQRDELRQWFNELGFDDQKSSLSSAHQTKDEPFSVNITVEFSDHERQRIQDNAQAILLYYYYRLQSTSNPMAQNLTSVTNLDVFDDFRAMRPQIQSQANAAMVHLNALNGQAAFCGTVEVSIDGSIQISAPETLRILLAVFAPNIYGFIDYNGAQRTFSRENVNSLNLQIDTGKLSRQQGSALYNHSGKYQGIKSQLASEYARRIIAEQAGGSLDKVSMHDDLEKSLKELFHTFIPGKDFEGIRPTRLGGLTFDVITSSGRHDINDLSSGEKELIYGYLQLRNSGVRDSVILIDEPELHLNPRLTDGLPDFYYRHLSRPLNNQLWLVTHSDTILRQSMGYHGFSVFHMRIAGTYGFEEDQVVAVSAEDDLNRAIVSLVGDLAAYKPNASMVLLEGGGSSEIDSKMVAAFFPEFAQRVNLISSNNKAGVRQLHRTLEKLGDKHGLFHRVYSIVDKDTDDADHGVLPNRYRWDRYHIENYLLEASFVARVISDVSGSSISEETALCWLKEAAAETVDDLVRHSVENYAYRKIKPTIKLRTDRNIPFDPSSVAAAALRSVEAATNVAAKELTAEELTALTRTELSRLNEALRNGRWIDEFRGRDILKRLVFARLNGNGINYDAFRNSIIARMRDAKFRPAGMSAVIENIEDQIDSSAG